MVELGSGPAFRNQVAMHCVLLDLLCWLLSIHPFVQQVFGQFAHRVRKWLDFQRDDQDTSVALKEHAIHWVATLCALMEL